MLNNRQRRGDEQHEEIGKRVRKVCEKLLRLMIVDDHEVVRDGMAILFAGVHIDTVAKCAGVEEATACLTTSDVNVALIDVRLNDGDGFAVLDKIQSVRKDVACVMMSSFENETYVARAVALGAQDFIYKSMPSDEMIDSILRAARGRQCPGQGVFSRLRDRMHARISVSDLPADMPLTPREAQVLRHVGLGLSNREIASSLSISVETVKEHVQNVLRKLEAADRTDAAVRAVRAGIV